MPALEVRPAADEREIADLSKIAAWAFGSTPADAAAWWSAGLKHVRVALAGSRVVGGLLKIPMGQWFGGRSVPMVGVAGVCVAPEERGRGVAVCLMRALLEELGRDGIALSALYPATHTLYRAVGYEQAGSRFRAVLDPGKIDISERDLPLREARDSDLDRISAAYTRYASTQPGHLDRGSYAWKRVVGPRGEPSHGWLVPADGEVEGYAFMTQRHSARAHYGLAVSDIIANSARAARRLLTLLADQRSLGDSVTWHTGPADSLLALLPERIYKLELSDYFMLRLVDVRAALEARGYPAGLQTELEIEVSDPVLPDNQRCLRLCVSDGQASVEPGGAGLLRAHTRGLAALYSGFLSAHALRRLGLLDANERVLETATAVFAGAAPAMIDHF